MSTTISVSNATLSFGNGGSYSVTGSNDHLSFGTGASITLTGQGNQVAAGTGSAVYAYGGNDSISFSGTNGYVCLYGGTGYTVNGDTAGNLVNLTGNTTATVNGAGGTIGICGSAITVTASNETINSIGAINGDTIIGTGDTINQGSGDSFNLAGGGDTLTMQGNTNYVGLLGGNGYVINNDAAGNLVNILGNTAATINGVGGSIGLLGSGIAIAASNETVNAVVAITNDTVTGNGDTVNEATGDGFTVAGIGDTIVIGGGNATLTMQGTNDYALVQAGSNYVVDGDTATNLVNLTANTSTTVNGAGGAIGLCGSTIAVTASNETVNTIAGISNDTVTGSFDTVNEAANDSIFLTGANTTLTMLGANDFADVLTGTGFVINGDTSGDLVNVSANTATTVNGAKGVIGLCGSGISVTASNETFNSIPNTQNDTITGFGDTIYEVANDSFNVAGGNDTVSMVGGNDYAGLLGGGGYTVLNDTAGDRVNLTANTSATVTGTGGAIGLCGSNDVVAANNESIGTVAGDAAETVNGSGNTISESFAGVSVTVNGNTNSVSAVAGTMATFAGQGGSFSGSGDTVTLGNGSASVTVTGNADTISSAFQGNTIGVSGQDDTVALSGGWISLNDGGTSVLVAGSGDTVSSAYAGDTIGIAGQNDVAQVSGAAIDVSAAGAGSLSIDGAGDSVITVSGPISGIATADSQTLDDIDAIYNAVLCRDPSAADVASARVLLGMGGTLSQLQTQLANSAEAQADMASTYAAAAGSGANLALLDAQPQSTGQLLNTGGVQAQNSVTPTQQEFAGFADAMSTSYGAPIELFSVDPASGAETVLADTSATNLLAELPVLETLANGAALGLQLADGTQIQFASTARAATFLYSLAVQQMQATSFVTDNYNLDMQWLNTVDQPLLEEAEYWTERAQAEASAYPERTVLDNQQANLALQIAAEAPSARQNLSVTIHNAQTGNPTQITVYANGGSAIHDVAPSVFATIEGAVSTVLSIAAVVTGNAYLYFAAAAIDAAESGQDFANGQDMAGILNLAEAVAGGILGATGGTTPLGTTPAAPLSTAQVTAQAINIAAEGVGGVYGVVTSAENGNVLGVLAGVLEAAAAGAAGIGLYEGGPTQAMLQSISTALTAAGVATTMGSDFASGNLGQGLLDSLNLFLPILAQEYVAVQASIGPGVSVASISPTPDMLGTPQHLAFVGGFFDSTISALGGHSVYDEFIQYRDYAASIGITDVKYFTWTDASSLAQWVGDNKGQVTIIAHSYGADTAASVVANGAHVQTLVTLDPVSYVRPDFQQVAANSGQWLNYVAAGGGLTFPNAIAGLGSSWNDATRGYATSTVDVNTDHANIAGYQMLNRLLGH